MRSGQRTLRVMLCPLHVMAGLVPAIHVLQRTRRERRGWHRKSGVPDFRAIKRDRKSETSDLRVSSPAMTWRGPSANKDGGTAGRVVQIEGNVH